MADDPPSKGKLIPYFLDFVALALVLGAEEAHRAGQSWHVYGGELTAGFVCLVVAFRWSWIVSITQKHNPWRNLRVARIQIDELSRSTLTPGTISLMSVDFSFEYNARVDLGHPITIRPVFRNDYSVSKHIRAIRWKPTTSDFPASAAKRREAELARQAALADKDPWDVDEADLPKVPEPVSSKIKDEGFQTKPPDDTWSPRSSGFASLVVHPNDVFRAGIEVRDGDLTDLEKLRDSHRLGTLTLTVDSEEVAFNL